MSSAAAAPPPPPTPAARLLLPSFLTIYVSFSLSLSLPLPLRLAKVNPLGTVPILKATGSYVVDSDTIADWLELKYVPDTDDARKPLGKVAECPQP